MASCQIRTQPDIESEAVAPRPHEIAIQPLGLAERDLETVRGMLRKIGQRLGVKLELQRQGGDILLLGTPFASRAGADATVEREPGRPVIPIETVNGRLADTGETLHIFGRRKGDLLRQLMDLALVRQRSPLWHDSGWSCDPGASMPAPFAPGVRAEADFDAGLPALEDLDGPRLEFVQAVLDGMADPSRPSLAASYGPSANLAFDFGTGLATIDRQALHFLRVRRELPLPAPRAAPQADAIVRRIDETVWDIGLCAGHLSLLGQPDDWRDSPLESVAATQVERYSRLPHHLDAARRLAAAAATPTELRRHAHIGEEEVRCFV
ncbi:MAG: hypothetical protein KGL43_18275, partial [Burkholderiales bacterium]|nr:hypothetical protein [Burkholderiales bacterium]